MSTMKSASRFPRSVVLLSAVGQTLNLGVSDATEGEWRTINGAKVFIRDGVVEKGPKSLQGKSVSSPSHLVGKTVAQVEAHGKAADKAKPGYHRIQRDAVGNYQGTHGPDGLTHVQEHADRLRQLKIPAGYHGVHLAENPNADQQANFTDDKGKTQYKYGADHGEKAANEKWARAKRFANDLPAIRSKIAADPSEEAAALRLIDHTGFRIGGEADTGAEKQAYGATTLLAEHVKPNGSGGAHVNFVGKKGVDNSHEITDPSIAGELLERARGGGKLYNTNDARTRDFLHQISPGTGYKVKDFRTRVANATAASAMREMPSPTNAKELNEAIGKVSEIVSRKLGNTPNVARKDYISPETFAPWHSTVANLEQANLISRYGAAKGISPEAAAKEWIPKHAAKFRSDFKARTVLRGVNMPKIGKLNEAAYLSRSHDVDRPQVPASAGRAGDLRSSNIRPRSDAGRDRSGNCGSREGRSSRRIISAPILLSAVGQTLNLSADDQGGIWRTINGTHVLIHDGKVIEGPAALRAHHEAETERHGRAAQRAHAAGDTKGAAKHEQAAEAHEQAAYQVGQSTSRKATNAAVKASKAADPKDSEGWSDEANRAIRHSNAVHAKGDSEGAKSHFQDHLHAKAKARGDNEPEKPANNAPARGNIDQDLENAAHKLGVQKLKEKAELGRRTNVDMGVDPAKDPAHGMRLHLVDVRKELPQYTRAEQDAALMEHAKRGNLVLYGMDDPKEIRATHSEEAAFQTPGGEKRHLMYWVHPFARKNTAHLSMTDGSTIDLAFNPEQPRDRDGRWTSDPGAILAYRFRRARPEMRSEHGKALERKAAETPGTPMARTRKKLADLNLQSERAKTLQAIEAEKIKIRAAGEAARHELYKKQGKLLDAHNNMTGNPRTRAQPLGELSPNDPFSKFMESSDKALDSHVEPGEIAETAQASAKKEQEPAEPPPTMPRMQSETGKALEAKAAEPATITPERPNEAKAPDAGRGSEPARREPVADAGGNGGGQPGSHAGQSQGAAKISTIRAEHTSPADPGVIHPSVLQHLAPHQVQATAAGIAAMDKHGGFLNMSGTGAGKTRTALATAQTFAARGNKVLIVTPKKVIQPDFKKGTIAGSYHNDAKAMGVETKLNDGTVPLEGGKIHVTTYDRFKKLGDQVGKDTTLIFDEAHAGKNYASAIAGDMRDAGRRAQNVLYATATPADKPMHIGAYERAKLFGDRHPFETFQELGMRQVNQHVGGGRYQKVWQRDPKISDEEAERRMSGLFDRATKEGLAIKHEVSMDNATVENKTVPLPPEAHELMGKIAGNYDSGKRAQSLMAQRLQQEPFKVAAAVQSVKDDLAAGRRPIVFAGRVNESTVGGEDKDDPNAIAHSEGTLKTLKEALAKEGIHDVSEIHGGVSDAARARGVADFQAGKNRVLIGTVNSAGTGINLDDTVGNAPRTLTNMTAPFSANEVVQAAGRVNRLSTKSPAIIRNLYADTDVDDWNRGLTETKLKTLGAAVGGDVRKLDVDYTPAAQTEPYQWRSLTRPEMPRMQSATGAMAAKTAPNASLPAAAQNPIVRVQGNTFPHKETLKRLGFRWNPDRKEWSRPRAGFNPATLPRGLTHLSRGDQVTIDLAYNPENGHWITLNGGDGEGTTPPAMKSAVGRQAARQAILATRARAATRAR